MKWPDASRHTVTIALPIASQGSDEFRMCLGNADNPGDVRRVVRGRCRRSLWCLSLSVRERHALPRGTALLPKPCSWAGRVDGAAGRASWRVGKPARHASRLPGTASTTLWPAAPAACALCGDRSSHRYGDAVDGGSGAGSACWCVAMACELPLWVLLCCTTGMQWAMARTARSMTGRRE